MNPRSRMSGKTQEDSKLKVPKTFQEWVALMQKVIERAVLSEDKRLPDLRRALVEGKSETMLRRMNIVCDNDIQREFPNQ